MKRNRQENVKYRDSATNDQQGVQKKVQSNSNRVTTTNKQTKINEPAAPIIHDWNPPSVALSSRDVAQQLILLDGQMTVLGVDEAGGGYRMVRATHGVHNGPYFWEAEILPSDPPNEQAHIRLGWSTRLGELQAPVGYDKHSYAYRDINGSKVHNSNRVDKYGEPYGPGDIIGCYLYLDIEDSNKNQMRFFKNGKDQGVAYRGSEIPQGSYLPAVSLFKSAQARVNFGPSFILRHDIYGANAVSEVQPMSPEDRKLHEQRVLNIRQSRAQSLTAVTGNVPLPL